MSDFSPYEIRDYARIISREYKDMNFITVVTFTHL
jgi:hypothetical protein